MNHRIYLVVYLILVSVSTYSLYSFSPVFAEEKDARNYHNSDLCSDLRQQFGEIRKVVNIENVSEEQLKAIGSLRVFLVEKFDCFDEFEDFEWD